MKLKTLFFFLGALATVFFLYFLISTRGCCQEPADIQANQKENEVTEEAGMNRVEMKTLHFGDVMLDRGIGRSIEKGVNPFQNVQDFIRNGEFDAVIINLEGPFTNSTDCQIKPYSFRFNPAYVSFLVSTGITAANVANNHSNDCYSKGIVDTREILEQNGIHAFGNDASSLLAKDSVWYMDTFNTAFLGFDETLGLQSTEAMAGQIEEATSSGRHAIVDIHWGDEYKPYPNATQREIARLFASKGARLIIGHHPHVIEPAEIIGKTVVFYSLGNFVFDQDTKETQTGYAVEEYFTRGGQADAVPERVYTLHPYRINGHTPTFLEGEEKNDVCREVTQDLLTPRNQPCSFTILGE